MQFTIFYVDVNGDRSKKFQWKILNISSFKTRFKFLGKTYHCMTPFGFQFFQLQYSIHIPKESFSSAVISWTNPFLSFKLENWGSLWIRHQYARQKLSQLWKLKPFYDCLVMYSYLEQMFLVGKNKKVFLRNVFFHAFKVQLLCFPATLHLLSSYICFWRSKKEKTFI